MRGLKINAGTPGFVRRAGETKWKEHRATMDSEVSRCEVSIHKPNYSIVTKHGWEFMVLTRFLEEGWPIKKDDRYGNRCTFNKCILGRNGRGASRRRAAKYRR
jgi:hypothetical protein